MTTPRSLTKYENKARQFVKYWETIGDEKTDLTTKNAARNGLIALLLAPETSPYEVCSILNNIHCNSWTRYRDSGLDVLFDSLSPNNSGSILEILIKAYSDPSWSLLTLTRFFQYKYCDFDMELRLISIVNKFGFELLEKIINIIPDSKKDERDYDELSWIYHDDASRRHRCHNFEKVDYNKLLIKSSHNAVIDAIAAIGLQKWLQTIGLENLELYFEKIGELTLAKLFAEDFTKKHRYLSGLKFYSTSLDDYLNKQLAEAPLDPAKKIFFKTLVHLMHNPVEYYKKDPQKYFNFMEVEMVKLVQGKMQARNFHNLNEILNIINLVSAHIAANGKPGKYPDQMLAVCAYFSLITSSFPNIYTKEERESYAKEKKSSNPDLHHDTNYRNYLRYVSAISSVQNISPALNFIFGQDFLRATSDKHHKEKNPLKLQLIAYTHLHQAAKSNHAEAMELLRSLIKDAAPKNLTEHTVAVAQETKKESKTNDKFDWENVRSLDDNDPGDEKLNLGVDAWNENDERNFNRHVELITQKSYLTPLLQEVSDSADKLGDMLAKMNEESPEIDGVIIQANAMVKAVEQVENENLSAEDAMQNIITALTGLTKVIKPFAENKEIMDVYKKLALQIEKASATLDMQKPAYNQDRLFQPVTNIHAAVAPGVSATARPGKDGK